MEQRENKIVIGKDLICLDLEASNSIEVISKLGKKLVDRNLVKQEYIQEVLEREKKFPTGLPTIIPVALPHADAESCYKTSMAIGVLKKPVKFFEMGNPENELNVELIFMLAIVDHKEQVIWIKNMMRIFKNIEVLKKIKNARKSSEIEVLLKNQLLINEEDAI